MKILEPTNARIAYLVEHMRAVNVRELSGSRVDLLKALIEWQDAMIGLQVLADDAGNPCNLIGVLPRVSGPAGMIYLSTDGFPGIWLSWRRWWSKTFVPNVMMQFDCAEMFGICDPQSDKFRRILGFKCRLIVPGHGENDADFAWWEWCRPTVDATAASVACAASSSEGANRHV